MKERGILFTGAMVCALLDGRKTQTRRPMKHPEYFGCPTGDCPHVHQAECDAAMALLSPYGVPGDQLWVRETCRAEELRDTAEDGVRYLADGAWRRIENTREAAERWVHLNHYGNTARRHRRGAQVPSIHMPRWASRISLRISEVRAQRLNQIDDGDAFAEGVSLADGGGFEVPGVDALWQPTARGAYQVLWERINGPGSWAENPWVWAVSFERVPA